jgi:hypothetical protein
VHEGALTPYKRRTRTGDGGSRVAVEIFNCKYGKSIGLASHRILYYWCLSKSPNEITHSMLIERIEIGKGWRAMDELEFTSRYLKPPIHGGFVDDK